MSDINERKSFKVLINFHKLMALKELLNEHQSLKTQIDHEMNRRSFFQLWEEIQKLEKELQLENFVPKSNRLII